MKNIIEEYANLKQRMAEVDTDKLWEYYLPNSPANQDILKDFISELCVEIPKELMELYQIANGWNCFYQMVDLFCLDDYHSDKMDYAKTLLVTELEYQDEFKINELLPIAVSRDDMDLFVIVVGGSSLGQVIWFAGGIIERFDSIKSFLSGMMGYSKADMKDLLN